MAHNHPVGMMLIADILTANADPNANTYDVLRLPLYKSYDEHNENHQNIQNEISNANNPCTCPGQAAALAGEQYLTI
jgi:hypothetical protein